MQKRFSQKYRRSEKTVVILRNLPDFVKIFVVTLWILFDM